MDANVCFCSLNIVIVPDPNQDQILPAGLAADNNLLTGIVEYFNAASESSRFVRGSLILILRCPIAPLVAFGVFASEKVGNRVIQRSVSTKNIFICRLGHTECLVLLEIGKEPGER